MGWIADYAKLQRSDSGRVDWLAKSEQFASRLVEREFADSGGSGLRSLQAHLVTYRGREGVRGAVYKQIEDKWVTAQSYLKGSTLTPTAVFARGSSVGGRPTMSNSGTKILRSKRPGPDTERCGAVRSCTRLS